MQSPLLIFVLVCFLDLFHASLSAETSTDLPSRENSWVVAVSSRKLVFKTSEGRDIHHFCPSLDLSRGWIKPNMWFSLDLSLVLGPNNQTWVDSPAIDYTGTGLSARWGIPLSSSTLRQESGDWGFLLGFEGFQISGQSFRSKILGDGSTSDRWTVRSRWTAIFPGLFYSSFRTARPRGNKPEWMLTRIEGYLLQLGWSYPLGTHVQIDADKNQTTFQESSSASGHILWLSFGAWLGI